MAEQTERYQILNEIGRGGFAVVYRAHDTQLDRPVALKELHPHLLGDASWVERFRREARLIARLNHPHIVPIYDIGQDSNRQFLIMSLVEGPGLDKLLAGRGRLPWPEALEIIRAVAEGLDYAHSQHILHRDLKPANILMDPARGPLLSDFGLAKLVSDDSLSQSGSIVGTPHYIPPEIWDGEPATSQADIYALGCILYELLTGERLFGGNTPPAIMMAHFRPLVLPKQWPEGVSHAVVEVLNVALAKQPKQRYATAEKMVEALLNLSGFGNLTGLKSFPPAPHSKPVEGPPPSPSTHTDWGEAPDVINFYGREAEAEQLTRWLIEERCRLVAILGIGGLGKTTLVTHLADQLQAQFDYVIWRSLRNAPPLEEVLEEWLLFLSDQQIQALPSEIDKRLLRLLEYLRQKRCLLILDNVETLLHEEKEGHYRPGYEGYGHLLQRVGETRHQSCLVLTSREKPAEFVRLEGDSAPVRSLRLPHLAVAAGRALLQDKGLAGPAEAWQALSERYSGNPLALKVVAETIRELFNGDIAAFLAGDLTIFGGIRELLAEQFERLSPLEQELMIWLAIEREPIGPEQLQTNLMQPTPQREMLEQLRALRRRSLLERSEMGFTLQNVVMEYVTGRLVETVSQEVIEGEVTRHLNRYALLKAQAKEYVRASQSRLILQPIVERMGMYYGIERLEAQLKALVVKLQQSFQVSETWKLSSPQPGKQTTEVSETSMVSAPQRGYAGGNLLNLLLHLKPEVRGLDFSGLPVWQAYLQQVRVREVNFSRADLKGSVFTDSFGAVLSVALSPDSQLLAAGTTEGPVRVWRAIDGQLLLTCEGHTDLVKSVRFSPDGRTIASSSWDQTIRLWDLHTGQCLKILPQDTTTWGDSLCFSPDGQSLASGSGQTVRLWDVGAGECLKTLEGHTDEIWSVSFSPDGQSLVSGSCDLTIRLWDVSTSQCLNILEGHTNPIEAVSFSPDGRSLASGSGDQTIRLWDVGTGQCLNILEGHTHQVASVCFSPDGHTLGSGSQDQTIRLWDLHTGQCLKRLLGHTSAVNSVYFSPDGSYLASGAADPAIRLWDVSTSQCLKILQGHIAWVQSVCFSPDRQSLAGGGADYTIPFWDVRTGQELKTFQGHTNAVRSISFSPNGQSLASGSDDHTIRLWDMGTGQCLKILEGHTAVIHSVSFSPDGQSLVSGSDDQTIRLWDVGTGQCLKILEGHTAVIHSVSFSPDGRSLASSSEDQTVRLWDVGTGQCLKILEGHTAVIHSVSFSPDGRSLASTGGDLTVRLWDVDTSQCLKTLPGHTNLVWSVCFSPDGQSLASGSFDRTIRLWDVSTGQCLKILEGHTHIVFSVCFSPDGQTLASGGGDETVKLWEVETGTCLKTLRLPGPYQGMNITGATGLSEAQKATLKVLGAISDRQGYEV